MASYPTKPDEAWARQRVEDEVRRNWWLLSREVGRRTSSLVIGGLVLVDTGAEGAVLDAAGGALVLHGVFRDPSGAQWRITALGGKQASRVVARGPLQ